jgi:zinc protease
MPSSTNPPPVLNLTSRYWPCAPSRFALDNGLKVLVAQRAGSPVVEMRFVFDGGFAADPRERSGLAGLAMAMITEGALRVGAARLGVTQESLGAVLHGRVTADAAVIGMSALTANLADPLAAYAHVLSNPEFSAEDLERVRANRLALIIRERLSPLDLALRVLPPMLYGQDHPYARPFSGSGTERGVAAITTDELREYYAEHLVPARGTLVVAGQCDAAKLKALLEDAFARWRTAPNLTRLNLARLLHASPAVAATTRPAVIVVDRPGALQAALVAGLPTPKRSSPGAEALMAANAILGGMFTSRLNMSLRESKGWTYGVRSSLFDARFAGLWLINSAVRRDRAARAMTEIASEIENLAGLDTLAGRRPCSREELGRAVDYLVARMPSMYETCAQIADAVADGVIQRLPVGYHREVEGRLRRLNPSDVTETCRQILAAGDLRWLIVGDAGELAGQLDDGAFGKIEIAGSGSELL